MPVCPVCRSQNMDTAKFCGNCGNPFPRVSETTSSLRKCEQGHIYSAVYQACPYCPQGNESKKESMSFETRIEEIPSFAQAPPPAPISSPADFMTRIDAPIPADLPSLPSPPNFNSPRESDLATRIESPIPSEFITRIEPIPPTEMATRIEEPLSLPTFDLVGAVPEPPPLYSASTLPDAPPPPAPAPLPRTELLGYDSIFVTRGEAPPTPPPIAVSTPPPMPAQMPPSMMDLNWPTPPSAIPGGASYSATLPSEPLPAEPSHFSKPLEDLSAFEVPVPVAPPPVVAPPAAPPLQSKSSTASLNNPNSQAPNRSTMVMSAEDLKKSFGSKGKLVGWLVSYARTPDGEDFKLHSGYNRIGANPACDIVVEDDTVSGSHAIIVFREGRYLIKDDLSRNGTFVNGKEITEAHPLQNYDQVRVGNTSLVFVAAQKF